MNGARPSLPTKLRAIVDSFSIDGFAVIDGGHFRDLPADLQRERLFARSLFLDSADVEVQAAGPWLVALAQAPDATNKVSAIVGDKPAAVFWCCDGEMVLWRHLRSLNLARIPVWAANGEEAPSKNTDEAQSFEAVMFRHWDPSVLGALMPVLDSSQFSRMLGRAREIAFDAKDYGGVKRIPADDGWATASSGLLTIRSDQVGALTGRRLEASHRRIMSYIREVAPDHTVSISDDDLIYQVRYSESVGRDLGITTERAQAQWAFLMVTSKGQIANEQKVIDFITASNSSPDRQVDAAMRQAIGAARERDGAG